MIISQSFRSKLDNGSFGEETFYSTKSDLVFMSDKDGNSQSLTERIAGKDGIEASIAFLNEKLTQEIEDRVAAVAQEEEDRIEAVAAEASFREAAIAQEVTDRDAAINTAITNESTLRVTEEARIENLIIAETKNRSDADSIISFKIDNTVERVSSLETFQENTELELNAINTTIGTMTSTVSIADQLANIIARLEVIEAQLNPTV